MRREQIVLGSPGVMLEPSRHSCGSSDRVLSVQACAPSPCLTVPSLHALLVCPELRHSASASPSSCGSVTFPTACLYSGGGRSIISIIDMPIIGIVGGQCFSEMLVGADGLMGL